MSVAKVLRLDEYRDRRTHRLRLAEALHRVDPIKHSILSHLVQIADLSGADRVATVWVDEYGAGLIHPYVVLDQLYDRPRRHFSPEPLHEAWELGVPSAYDRPQVAGSSLPATLAVALGSDGTRAWFVVAESLFARPTIDAEARDRIMFLAGECASVVLHRDLDPSVSRATGSPATTFAGWPILEDLEGREEDEVVSVRIARRFVVGRLARMLVDDDLAVAPERMADQVRRARAELELAAREASCEGHDEHDEGARWARVLDALEAGSYDTLASELVALGDVAEGEGHVHGALELYACGHRISAAVGACRPAVDAAQLTGRLLRRQARWDEARRWFDITQAIADAAGLPGVAARALVGLGGIKKELGNLPAAQEAFGAALSVAEKSGDRDTIALVHHGLLGVEQALGNVGKGLQHGWLAVATYENEKGRTRCMASIAAALLECGDRDAAEDAWSLVAHTTTDTYYLVYAHDALAHLCALKGDLGGFSKHAERCDALDWAALPSAKAEILLYRGLSYRALGRLEQAREWLSRAVEFAEANHYNQTLFRAEEALRTLDTVAREQRPSTAMPATAPREVREGLRAMRQELVGAGA